MSKFDKIWIIPYNRATVRLLFRLFGTEITILESLKYNDTFEEWVKAYKLQFKNVKRIFRCCY